MLVLLWVALSMLARDALATLLVVAEAKGRHWLAGSLDASSDVAQVVCTLYGAGEIILHGWNVKGLEILAVMCVTSFFGTAVFTKLGQRIKAVSCEDLASPSLRVDGTA